MHIDPDISCCEIQPSGLRMGYVSRGKGPLVIFLHGFPDTFRGFLPILDVVAAAGYRAVAPALRGYGPTALAPDGDYRVEASAKDAVGLADALGADRFSVVGHDWGAATAYAASNLAPDRIDSLITAAVPHTGHFFLTPRLKQLFRSRYILGFQLPSFPERSLSRNDFAGIESLIRRWSPDWAFGETEMRPLKDNYAEQGRLTAALSYYRQLPRSLLSPLSRRLIFSPVVTPTRTIFGLRDGCFGAEMFANQERLFPGGLDLVPLAEAGHFMQWEQPTQFARLVVDFLNSKVSLSKPN
ncbi:alpha/beta hydrolase [Bradyrhizobium sp. LA2.1]|uniref:alpha/beta fold hydrolase n=1 Tax=Bradyrhizobium sp. LA2.1 TaxID=3156376 RepID=UPI00339723CE